MLVKNKYGADIMIPFGDWEPNSVWNISDGIVYVVDSENNIDDFGAFTDEGYLKILEGWEQFQREYTWLPDIYKWLPNSMVDKDPTK